MARSGGAEGWMAKVASAEEAVSDIPPGARVFIGSGCAAPQTLVQALAARGPFLADTQVFHVLNLGLAPYTDPTLTDQFRHNAFFIGANVRQAVAEGRADYTPIFLSELPRLFRSGRLPIDVALIQVSPPDAHGWCSYGVSVDVVKSATESARRVIAEINPQMPRTLGDSFVHVDRLDRIVHVDYPILEVEHGEPDDVARRIATNIAELIGDGDTLQLGIGTIPDAVLACLTNHRDLGIHTEMFSDGVIDLVERGVVTGARKSFDTGRIVASFVLGTRRLFDFVDNNPLCDFRPTEYTNDPFRIAQHRQMVSINAALEVDLSGQVCADSIGTYLYSGVGGQVDFGRGAARSEGGRAIIALPSTAEGGTVSRISATLAPGAGVVTTRAEVHYVVTEHGIAYLHGKSIRERAMALIEIAAPEFREELLSRAQALKYVHVDWRPGALVDDELAGWRCEMTTEDGRAVLLRPGRPADEDALREMFYSLSPQTVYQRFFSPLKALPHRRRVDFLNVDPQTEVLLVGIDRAGPKEQMVAAAAYHYDRAEDAAELSFVVRDGWQDVGIGSALFDQLVTIGQSRGIRRYHAAILSDNMAMVRVFHKCARGPVESRLDIEEGVYHLAFTIGGQADSPST